MNKQVFIKTYARDGTYKGVFFNFSFSSFQMSLNGGVGDLTVIIPRKFDEFNNDGAISLGYELRIYISDKESISGKLIYSGEIDDINPSVGADETVTINCSGWISQLADDLLESSQNILFEKTSVDISAMIKDFIDAYKAARTDDKISYTASSIATTGKTANLKVYGESPLSAIIAAARMADVNWFFRVGADNIFYFNAIPTTPTHYFMFGKDIAELKINRNIRDTKNAVLFANGLGSGDPQSVLKLYSDSGSITSFGRRVSKQRDGRYRDSSSIDEAAGRELDAYSQPINVVTLRIVDSNNTNGYDIESIKPGDTFKVLNISANDALTSNMLITTVTYNIDSVDIVATDTIQYVDRLLSDMGNKMTGENIDLTLPSTYTT